MHYAHQVPLTHKGKENGTMQDAREGILSFNIIRGT